MKALGTNLLCVRVLLGFAVVAVVACDEKPITAAAACEETVSVLTGPRARSDELGLSLAETLSGHEELSTTILWDDTQQWVGLKAEGVTTLRATLEYRDAPIEMVRTKRGDLVTNDPTVCVPHLRSELVLTAESGDRSLSQSTLVRWIVYERNLITSNGRLETSSLVAPGVRLDWAERIESGERVGCLVASSEDPHDSGVSLNVHTVATWAVSDPGAE